MKTIRSLLSPAVLIACSLTFLGCSAPTKVRITGTPGTQISGRYQANHVSTDFNGTAAWQMDFGNQRLQQLEFRKASPEHSVELEIWRGRKQLVHATAEPGISGLRVDAEGQWKVERLN